MAAEEDEQGLVGSVERVEGASPGFAEGPKRRASGVFAEDDTLFVAINGVYDRLLLAQALSEGMTLLTSGAQLAQYPGPVRRV